MFWNKKVVTQPQQNPRITFELNPDGNILIHCSWPRPKSNEAAVEFVQNYMMMIYMINSGKLLPTIESSISRFNSADGVDAQLSSAIVAGLHMLLEDSPILEMNADKVVVSPTTVFSVRGE